MDDPGARRPAAARPTGGPLPWLAGLAALCLLALAARLWGLDHGLPYAYNADENAHFVPNAIGLFGHSLNPHYFVNPPAYTYVLHVVFAVWFGGREGVQAQYAADPTEVLVVARATAAVLSTMALPFLYLAGAKLLGRPVGLLAAAVLAVSFLPVFYAHLGLNDAVTLLPVCAALWAIARVLREGGRTRDFALAGLLVGLAAATKYTGGIVALALAGAALGVLAGPGARARAGLVARGLGVAVVAALAGFLLANPYALLAFSEFVDGISHQTSVSADDAGKLGFTSTNGVLYYLQTLTWGVGWVPAVLALLGALALWRTDRRALAVLLPAAVVFLLFMGTQARFFGRWLMPILPLVCLLGAYGTVRLVVLLARRAPRLGPAIGALAAVALLVQGTVATLHAGQVLSRPDTRNETRAWLAGNLPATQPSTSGGRGVTKLVVEPVVPDGWVQDVGRPSPLTVGGNRWVKYPTSRSLRANDGRLLPEPGRVVNIEDYERTLFPGLIDDYIAGGFCWVVTGSTQRGRSEAQPDVVPDAVDYYRALERRGELVHVASPYAPGARPVAFNFDSSFNFRPLAYERPGPLMAVYRLREGRCAQVTSGFPAAS